MAGAILFLLTLLSGVDAQYLVDALKLRFVSPETSVDICGKRYTIRSTCLPVFKPPEDDDDSKTVIAFPEGPMISADVFRNKPEVLILEEGMNPWPAKTYCILMGHEAPDIDPFTGYVSPYASRRQPYIYWLVCDIPGNHIEEGMELVPYAYTPLSTGVGNVKFWLIVVPYAWGEYSELESLTSPDCGIQNRCQFLYNAFLLINGFYEEDTMSLTIRNGVWSSKQLALYDTEPDEHDCTLIDLHARLALEDPPTEIDDGHREYCPTKSLPRPVCRKSGRPNPATSWGKKYIDRLNSKIRSCGTA